MVAVILLISAMICIAEEKIIVAAANPWPPFVDPAHPKEGFTLEIIRAAFKTQGYIVQMEYVPWARAEYGVRVGKYDFLPDAWMTEKRKKYLLFSQPYAVNEVKFIKVKDDPFEFNGLESLNGKIVGTVRGYGYGNEFLTATNFKREQADDFITNIKKLTHRSKRIDLTLEDEIVARISIAQEDSNLMTLVHFTENSLSSNALHVACGKKSSMPRAD